MFVLHTRLSFSNTNSGSIAYWILFKTRMALGSAHVPPTKLFRRLAPNTYRCGFPDVIKFRVAAHTISEKAIRFRHLDYNPDRAQTLISSSMSRHLSTRNMSSKSMHAFLSNLANRQTDIQTDKRTRANAFTSSFVGGNYRQSQAWQPKTIAKTCQQRYQC